MEKVTALITSHNRHVQTVSCLRSLYGGDLRGLILNVVLVDDGSTDGTAKAVQDEFPQVNVITGSGSLYWNGGMRLAWRSALDLGMNSDFFLWLNDDVCLNPAALQNLMRTYRSHPNTARRIVIGRLLSEIGDDQSYGGLVRAGGISRLRFGAPSRVDAVCDTMNGNCVLIPASGVVDIGINDEHYTHAFGDIDYGLRAVRAGYSLLQCAEPVARLEHGPAYSAPRTLTMRGFFDHMTSPKGMPAAEWLYFCFRHGGWIWPINFVSMYAKSMASIAPRMR